MKKGVNRHKIQFSVGNFGKNERQVLHGRTIFLRKNVRL